MANTYTALYYHIVFSTKHRYPWLTLEFEQRIWSYIGGIAREHKLWTLQVGGIDDHVHVLLGTPPTMPVSKAAQLIKGGSSKWIHDTFPQLHTFAWQDGYGAFTVSKSSLAAVTTYIQRQREHHRVITFQAELLAFLKQHEVVYDERYLWD